MPRSHSLNSRRNFRGGLDDTTDGESFSLSQSRYRSRTVNVETAAGLKVCPASLIVFVR